MFVIERFDVGVLVGSKTDGGYGVLTSPMGPDDDIHGIPEFFENAEQFGTLEDAMRLLDDLRITKIVNSFKQFKELRDEAILNRSSAIIMMGKHPFYKVVIRNGIVTYEESPYQDS